MNHFQNKKFVVDKLHIQNHTDHNCRETCHPNLFPDLKNINTMVCEQINFWLSKYKFITKHMHITRFHLYIFIILNQYNQIKINGRFSPTNNFTLVKCLPTKRKNNSSESD